MTTKQNQPRPLRIDLATGGYVFDTLEHLRAFWRARGRMVSINAGGVVVISGYGQVQRYTEVPWLEKQGSGGGRIVSCGTVWKPVSEPRKRGSVLEWLERHPDGIKVIQLLSTHTASQEKHPVKCLHEITHYNEGRGT